MCVNGPMTLKKLRIGAAIRKINRDMEIFKTNLYQLMAHPESTPEQIEVARQHVMSLQKRVQEVKHRLAASGYDPEFIL